MNSLPISRRAVLRGAGALLSLPWLEAMAPRSILAASDPGKMPVRLGFLYMPTGVIMQNWTPDKEGPDYEFTSSLEPLKEHKEDLLVLSGMTTDNFRPQGDGSGDHARGMALYLTATHPIRTTGVGLRLNVSADQFAAQQIGHHTRLGSLEIGCEDGNLGYCDPGYACIYTSTMSWSSANTPVPKITDPKIVFDRLFGSTDNAIRHLQRRASILDLVSEEAASLNKQLGASDRRKIDQYLSAVRDVEQRIERAVKLPPPKNPGIAVPTGIPVDYREHLNLLTDLMVLALQTDTTRVCTFVLDNERTYRQYRFLDVNESHHSVSHHGNRPDRLAAISRINRFHVGQFASLVAKLKTIPEGSGTLLDNCLISCGCGNSDPNTHSHFDLPILMAGKGGGAVKPRRHLKYAKDTSLCNLWLSKLRAAGIDAKKFGDSTGELPHLDS